MISYGEILEFQKSFVNSGGNGCDCSLVVEQLPSKQGALSYIFST
jgi:hypothetical protein